MRNRAVETHNLVESDDDLFSTMLVVFPNKGLSESIGYVHFACGHTVLGYFYIRKCNRHHFKMGS